MVIHVPPQYPNKVPCRIAFVGMFPGDEEIADMAPFTGPSGRVFDVILRAANLDRNECMVTNLFDEQPPQGDVAPWLRDNTKREEAFERLNAELKRAQPTVIVPLGRVALWAFTGHNEISDFRGSPIEATRVMPGAKLIPTYHPAAVMRKWTLLALAVQDVVKALAQAELGPKVIYPKRTLYLCPDIEDVEAYLLHTCTTSKLLSVDIETGWGCITCIGFAPTIYEAMCVPFVDLRQPNKSYWKNPAHEKRAWLAVRSILENREVPKVGQSYLYDAFWLTEYGLPTYNYRHDDRLMHHALYPELPKDLASMGGSYTDIPAWKQWAAHKDGKKDG